MTTNHTPQTPSQVPGAGGYAYPAGFDQPTQPGTAGYGQPTGVGVPGAAPGLFPPNGPANGPGPAGPGAATVPSPPPAPVNPSDTDCPCGHGDVVAEIAAQRPLLKAAVSGKNPEAFAQLYDEHVDGVYRYVMGWTGDHATTRELVEQVFRGAITWLPVIIGGEGDLGAWLITMARDTIGQQRGNSAAVGVPVPSGATVDLHKAVAQLDDAQREVVILRLLLGHSLAHTAHLAGYSQRVVMELQVAACAALWRLTGGAPIAQDGREEWRAQEFQRHIADWTVDFTGVNDAGLRDLLTVTAALRRIAPEWVAGPDDQYVDQLRALLIQDAASGRRKDSRAGGLAGAGAGTATGLGNPFRQAKGPWILTFLVGIVIVVFVAVQLAARLGQHAADTASSSAVSTVGTGANTTGPAAGGVTITTIGATSGTTAGPGAVIIPGSSTTTQGGGVPPTTVGGGTTQTTSGATTSTRRATTTTHRQTTTSTTSTTTNTTTTTTSATTSTSGQ